MTPGMRGRLWLSMLPMVSTRSSWGSRWGLTIGLCCLVGCGSLESEEAREVAVATQKTVSHGVDEARKTLERIDMDKVRRAWDSAVEAVQRATTRARDEPQTDPLAGAAEAITCDEARERCTVTAEFAARAREHGARLAGQLRVSPVHGATPGIRLDAIDAGSVAQRLGLRSGDVVTHVNRVPLASISDAMMLYVQVRAARRFTVDYRRGGQERVLVVDVV